MIMLKKMIFFLLCLFTSFALAAPNDLPQNVLMIGWDGSRLARIKELLSEKKLPVLQSIIDKGSFVEIDLKTKTDTKAGWAEILTGYDYTINHVKNNRFYDTIPKGLTVFERLKNKFGNKITTLLIAGKSTHLGIRGPHKVCQNCVARRPNVRELMEWWNEEKAKTLETVDKRERHFTPRGGEPYYNAYRFKAIDVYKNDLKAGENVLKFATGELEKLKGKKFFGFIHFQEPDEEGHLYGESSKQYKDAIVENDKRLGDLLKSLEKFGLNKNLKIFIVSDHGFDVIGSGRPDDMEHDTDAARGTFLASDHPLSRKKGDRPDIAAYVLKIFEFDLTKIKPALKGSSY
jgi:hypothetical protein